MISWKFWTWRRTNNARMAWFEARAARRAEYEASAEAAKKEQLRLLPELDALQQELYRRAVDGTPRELLRTAMSRYLEATEPDRRFMLSYGLQPEFCPPYDQVVAVHRHMEAYRVMVATLVLGREPK